MGSPKNGVDGKSQVAGRPARRASGQDQRVPFSQQQQQQQDFSPRVVMLLTWKKGQNGKLLKNVKKCPKRPFGASWQPPRKMSEKCPGAGAGAGKMSRKCQKMSPRPFPDIFLTFFGK